MGQHRIEITMVGGHGCDRLAKEGEALRPPCNSRTCPDCEARRFVQEFKARGCFQFGPDSSATLTHWPGTPGEVVDDLLTETRTKGSFSR